MARALRPRWHRLLPAMSPADPNLLTLLLDSTGEGVYGIDMDGCCTFVNSAAAQMLGTSTDMVLGRNMHLLMHHSHADGQHYPEVDCPIYRAFRQGQHCRIDHEVFWRIDGTPFWAEYASYPILAHGQVRGAVITFNDITDRKLTQDRLQRATAALQLTNDQLEQRVAERTQALSDALAQVRALSQHAEGVREAERTRIAREIHDELGSVLVALKMDLSWLGKRLDEQGPLQAKAQGMGQLVDRAVDNLGRIITDLRPSILDHQGLWAALEWHAQEFIDSAAAATGLQADLQVHVAPGVPEPDAAQAIAVFRIFQEILSNVARHAQARQLQLRITVDEPPGATLYLEVRDDGVGAPAGVLADTARYGVRGMQERAAHFGGRLTIDSAPGAGTRVRLVMPLMAAASAPAVPGERP